MARRRRLLFDSLETRLCMAAPVLQATVALPTAGAWTPTPVHASPIMADIFNSGRDDMIVVTSGAQLVAYGAQANGTVVPVMTYKVPNSIADIKSTPVVVTDPRTGRKDLFAAMGRDERADGSLEDGRIYGWDLATGQLLPAWANGITPGTESAGIAGAYGPLASADLDGDGVPEIVMTSYTDYVTALRLDGSIMWQYTNNDSIGSGVVIGDIDRTGTPSIVFGSDSSQSGFFQSGGWITALSNTGHVKWRKFIPNETISATPLLADLNNNGYLDVVVGTGLIYDTFGLPGARAAGNRIYALSPFGDFLPGWPYHTTSDDTQQQQVLGTLAVADMTGNGQLDVIGIDRQGILHVVQPNGQDLPAFAGGRSIYPELASSILPDDYASPIVADINGDGKPEIIAAAGNYIRAFDSSGNFTTITSTKAGTGGLYEGIDTAAVVGNMFGTPYGTLAFYSWDANQDNRPSTAYFYALPSTTLVPPYPSQRRTASGDAVVRSPNYDAQFVGSAFRYALGYVPGLNITAPFLQALNNDTLNLTQTARYIMTGPLTRQAEVQRAWQAVFGAAPDATTLALWSNYLATNSVRQMEVALVSGAPFASMTLNTTALAIPRLYSIFLGRSPGVTETAAWVASGYSVSTIASILANSDEASNYVLGTMFTGFYGPNTQGYINADTQAAFAYDFKRGAREEDLATSLVANNGNYAASNIVASYVADLYRDILDRFATSNEIAGWVRAIDTGAVSLAQMPLLMLNSGESRGKVVQEQYATLLGRFASAGEVAAMSNYSSRENLILAIVGSPEFYAHVGGNDSAYITAVCFDLAGITAPQALINVYLAAYAKGTPRVQIARDLMSNPSLYDSNQAVNFLMRYLPNERLGVLRTGNLPITGATTLINPDPTLLSYVTNLLAAGMSDEAVIGVLLSSPDYLGRVTYYKGIWRAWGIRTYT